MNSIISGGSFPEGGGVNRGNDLPGNVPDSSDKVASGHRYERISPNSDSPDRESKPMANKARAVNQYVMRAGKDENGSGSERIFRAAVEASSQVKGYLLFGGKLEKNRPSETLLNTTHSNQVRTITKEEGIGPEQINEEPDQNSNPID